MKVHTRNQCVWSGFRCGPPQQPGGTLACCTGGSWAGTWLTVSTAHSSPVPCCTRATTVRMGSSCPHSRRCRTRSAGVGRQEQRNRKGDNGSQWNQERRGRLDRLHLAQQQQRQVELCGEVLFVRPSTTMGAGAHEQHMLRHSSSGSRQPIAQMCRQAPLKSPGTH